MNSLINFSLLLETGRLKLLPNCNKFVTYAGMLVSQINESFLVRSNGLKKMPLNLSDSILMITKKDSLESIKGIFWLNFNILVSSLLFSIQKKFWLDVFRIIKFFFRH